MSKEQNNPLSKSKDSQLEINVENTGRFHGEARCGYCSGHFNQEEGTTAEFLTVYDGAVKSLVKRPFHPNCGAEVPNLEELVKIEKTIAELEKKVSAPYSLGISTEMQKEALYYLCERRMDIDDPVYGFINMCKFMMALYIPFQPYFNSHYERKKVKEKTGIALKSNNADYFNIATETVFAVSAAYALFVTEKPTETTIMIGLVNGLLLALRGIQTLASNDLNRNSIEDDAHLSKQLPHLKIKYSRLEKALFPEGVKLIEGKE